MLVITALAVASAAAQAALFQPTSAADSGPNTLRQAIIDANNTPTNGTPHTIDIRLIPEQVIELASALPVIEQDVWIFGNRLRPTIIDGNGNPVFFATFLVNVEVESIEFRNASAPSGSGAAFSGGASVSFLNCIFRNCSAAASSTVNSANVTFTACAFLDNHAASAGGAFSQSGGSAEFINCLFQNNTAARGGAVHAGGSSSVTLIHCTIVENIATDGSGGGVMLEDSATVTLLHNIISQNESTDGKPQLDNAPTAAVAKAGPNFIGGDPRLRPLQPRNSAAFIPSRIPYHDSPVVDVGTLTPGMGLTLPDYDSDLHPPSPRPRIFGPAPDLGAVECRYLIVSKADDSHGPGSVAEAFSSQMSMKYDEIHLNGGMIPVTALLPGLQVPCLISAANGSGFDGGGQRRGFGFVSGLSDRRIWTIEGLTFKNLTTHAISAGSSDLVTIRNCHFEGNSGNPLTILSENTIIENCSFVSNNVGRSIILASNHVTIRNTLFHNNQSFYSPAILTHGGNVNTIPTDALVEHVTATSNRVLIDDGTPLAMFQIDMRSIHVTHNLFHENLGPHDHPLPLVYFTPDGQATYGPNFTTGDPMLFGVQPLPNSPVSARFPMPGSPVIDVAAPVSPNDRDQAGRARPERGLSDFGAIEYYSDPYRAHMALSLDADTLADIASRESTWGGHADLDGDGASNLLELVTDGDPTNPAILPSTSVEIDENDAIFRFALRADYLPLAGTPRVTKGQLGNLLPVPPAQLAIASAADGLFHYIHIDSGALMAAPSRFYRLEFPEMAADLPILVGIPAGGPADPETLRGAVGYNYSIGKYEITNSEYTRFLNAADPSGANTLALYDSQMESSQHGGITFDPARPIGSRYRVKSNAALRPVNFVSYWSALRYCNWLHNGARSGDDIQSGAYTLTGTAPIPDNASTVARSASAKFFLPTTDEWYRAAYFANDDTIGGIGLWADYPVTSNTINTTPPPGNAQSANLHPGGLVIPALRPVGSYSEACSPFGAKDMAGNVRELTEAPFPGATLIYTPGGGAFDPTSSANKSSWSNEAISPTDPAVHTGFRVAARP